MPRIRKAENPTETLRRRVRALAMNLWWTWDAESQRLLAAIDPPFWEATNQNPFAVLARVTPTRLAALADDKAFLARLADCEKRLAAYLKAPTWFQKNARGADRRMLVAYFCAEFAIHESFPHYAGGLGVLAGDHLKAASDLGLPLVGVGLLYRCGYYRQAFDADGATRASYPELNFHEAPIVESGKTIRVPVGGRIVHAHIWKAQVGRTSLYLLDSDHPANSPRERAITRSLYGGDNETRIQQETLLGVGGMIALDTLGLNATVFHLNEGHAAFSALERFRRFMIEGASIEEAVEATRANTVFTTHTPVPAGHDRFTPALMKKTLAKHMAGVKDEWLALGRELPSNRNETFCMTVLALKLAQRCNGVSKLHGEVSRRMWQSLYGVEREADVPIGSITNGVHSPTWTAPEMVELMKRYLPAAPKAAGPEYDPWASVARIPVEELWAVRRSLRRRLVHFVRERLVRQILARSGSAAELREAVEAFDEDALTIGFARRFATYKRAPLVFHDAKRLARILGAPGRPVQLVFAGKAHPRDLGGQEFAQRVQRFAKQNGLRGRVVVLEDYDMRVGRELTSGCDLWLNNPLRPMEASGTSGMKPPLHGGLNCSILDGWWPEACDGSNGWAIGDTREQRTPAAQDRFDANSIYQLLEEQITPLFYQRDKNGIPRQWIRRMQASMRTVCAAFSASRMVADYCREYYLPAHRDR